MIKEMEYSSTGVNNLKPGEAKQSLIFEDYICPICGSKLLLDNRPIKGGYINVRFSCSKCNFICPIYHDSDNPDKISPKYDSQISDFIDNLGETINDKRVRMVNSR